MNEYEDKLAEYQKRAEVIDTGDELTKDGIPENIQERIDFLHEACTYIHGRIDFIFGAGTSAKLFGGMESLDMIEQFFVGLTPYVKSAREKKMAKYRS